VLWRASRARLFPGPRRRSFSQTRSSSWHPRWACPVIWPETIDARIRASTHSARKVCAYRTPQPSGKWRRRTATRRSNKRAAGLAQDVIKGEQKAKQQILTAPVDGVVQQLAVHTIGGVVTPAQTLAAVVPLDSNLEIEAMVLNRDIGFAIPGQSAAIKVDTFNFTRYGLLDGRVLGISRDAITRDSREDKARDQPAGSESASSEPKGQELVYAARVSLDRSEMDIEGRPVRLSPGMAVTVEIKTGSRRIISYLLSPLMRYNQEVLRER